LKNVVFLMAISIAFISCYAGKPCKCECKCINKSVETKQEKPNVNKNTTNTSKKTNFLTDDTTIKDILGDR